MIKVLEKVKEILLRQRTNEACPVCGGTMIKDRWFLENQYADLRCKNCGAITDWETKYVSTKVVKESGQNE